MTCTLNTTHTHTLCQEIEHLNKVEDMFIVWKS